MPGNFLSCLKGVNDPFKAQEGRWDFSRDSAEEKGFISRGGENLLGFPELGKETWGTTRVVMGTWRARLCCLREFQSPFVLPGASRVSSPVGAGA